MGTVSTLTWIAPLFFEPLIEFSAAIVTDYQMNIIPTVRRSSKQQNIRAFFQIRTLYLIYALYFRHYSTAAVA